MERHVDELLDALKRQLLKMSAAAEAMIESAIVLFGERDEKALDVIERYEAQVDRFQVEIDDACVTLIALHQPTAGDLRFIIGAAKINTEIERLADQAINLSHKAVRLYNEVPAGAVNRLPRMAAVARGMVRDSLHAYVNRDVALARAVVARDDELDQLKRDVTQDAIRLMKENPLLIERGLDLVLAARNLERIGDHAANVAEHAIYVAEGRDIRHAGALGA